MNSFMLTARLAPANQADSGTFRILGYTGGPMRVSAFKLPVVVDLSRLEMPDKIPILDGHSNQTRDLLGIGTPSTDGRELTIQGEWADTPGAQNARTLAKSGILQASVGVEPGEPRRITAPETINGQTIQASAQQPIFVVGGKLMEVSILPIGADSRTKVFSARGYSMSFEEWLASLGFTDPAALSPEQKAKLEEVYNQMNQPAEPAQQQPVQQPARPEPAQAAAVSVLRASRPVINHTHTTPTRPASMLRSALLVAGGRSEMVAKQHGEHTVLAARAVASQGWAGFARAALLEAGIHADGMNRNELLRAGFSNTAMPAALTESIQRLALEAFREQSDNWRMVARRVDAQDFRDAKAVRLVGATALQKVGKDGAIKHGQLTENAHPFSVATYARMLQLTRQDVINDDLSLFDALPDILAGEGSRLVSDLVFTELAGGLAANFFSTANGNLLEGAGSALGVTSLGNAIKSLRTQTDPDGRLIGLQPAVLIVPAALEATARQVLNSLEVARTADQSPTGNPWSGMNLELVVEPRLDASSATAWYLASRATDGGLLAAFLRGVEGPQVEQAQLEGAYLGIGMRAYLDCGAARAEHRAIVRANGTA